MAIREKQAKLIMGDECRAALVACGIQGSPSTMAVIERRPTAEEMASTVFSEPEPARGAIRSENE